MRHRKKIIWFIVLIAIIWLILLVLPGSRASVSFYDTYIFRPFQSFRNMVFGYIPFSIGDVLYSIGGVFLLIGVGRWIYYLVKFRTHRSFLFHSFINAILITMGLYILLMIGWGCNYYKPKLSQHWQLNKAAWQGDTSLIAFDTFLISRLNHYAPMCRPQAFKDINRQAQVYYRRHTDSRTRMHGLKVKPSVFGFMMQYLEIQGYYNPFTGEAQVNRFLPSFMLPFVVCHEMAHQSGIAAEDDANLLAYALASNVPDANFKYSAYFNIWLYTHNRLRRQDSTLANQLLETLNPVSRGHIDTLRAIRKKYRNDVSEYSGWLYDGYLKMHNQKDGLGSYNNVTVSAWAWEVRKKQMKKLIIDLP